MSNSYRRDNLGPNNNRPNNNRPTIRWAIVGCGDVARKRIVDAIRNDPNSELVAGCRRDPEKLRRFCDEMSIPKRYTDAAALMRDESIDAVYLATPVREHLPQTLLAASAGKHVLVEKPMAMTAIQCDKMIASCAAANVQLGVAYYRRFFPIIQRIEELLQSQAIGVPLCVAAVTSTPLAMPANNDGYWRTNHADSGGGALMDVGSHRINVFLHLFGPIQTVKAICTRVAARYETEDAAVLVMQFESGVVGTLQCHFGANDPDEFTILGTQGRLIARPLNGDKLVIEIGSQQTIESLPPPQNFCSPLIADFVQAINENRLPRIDGREGRATSELMDQAYADNAG